MKSIIFFGINRLAWADIGGEYDSQDYFHGIDMGVYRARSTIEDDEDLPGLAR